MASIFPTPKLPVLFHPYFVYAIADVLRHVKTVERNLLLRIRHVVESGVDVRWPHVHRNRFDRLNVLQKSAPVKAVHRLLLATVEYFDHPPAFRIVVPT